MLNMKPLKSGKVLTPQPNSARILEVWDLATDSEIEAGMSWYDDAHRIAVNMDPAEDVHRAAGVIAALSPRLDWGRNIMLAQRAYDAWAVDMLEDHRWGTLGANAAKAERILKGEHPEDVLKGDKVLAFYRAIVDGTGVVIDRHAFDVAQGRVTNDETRGALSRKGIYDAYATRYIMAAEKITNREDGVSPTPAQVQAVTWTVWRRLKNLPEHVTY